MSATCSGYLQNQGRNVRRRARRPTALMKAGTIAAALSLGMVLPARAADESQPRSLMRVAAVGGGSDNPSFQLGLPARAGDIDVDLKVLLAQNGPAAKTDAAAGEDTILVALALSVPQSVDEDIAKQHGLELLERTELPELGLRIVHFRAAGNRPIGPILADLRNDQRIRRAQTNAQYGLPTQGTPAPESPAVAAGPDAGAHVAARRRPDRKGAAVTRVAQKLAGQVPIATGGAVRTGRTPKGEPANESAYQPVRVGKVGDVLSGGL